MSERDRRAALRGASVDDLRRARGSEPASGPEQRAIDAILDGPPFDSARLDKLTVDELLAFATAARWFDGVVPGLPDAATLDGAIHRRRRLAAIDAIVGPRFAPRKAALDHLSAWLRRSDRPPLVLRGPGGMGKSALLARFIQTTCPPARFAWIDFDRPDVSVDVETISRVVDEHLAWQGGATVAGGTLIVVLDSFETSVQTYGYAPLNSALEALAKRFSDLAVIVGSRAAVPRLRFRGQAAEEYELPGLELAIAQQWLIEDGVAPGVAADAAAVARGVPLNLRLARDLLAGKSEAEAREALAGLPKQMVTGYLYRRILRRLSDETLREQAQWAMVPRRLVPELLAAVLEVSAEEGDRLFGALRREVTLLDGSTTLMVRPDLRNTLLPLLEHQDRARVSKIDRTAADFWSKRSDGDTTAAAEAIYHHLRRDRRDAAEALWRPGVEVHLRGYTSDELAPRAAEWLKVHLTRQSRDVDIGELLVRGDVTAARNVISDRRALGAPTDQTARARFVSKFLRLEGPVDIEIDLGVEQTLEAQEAAVLARWRPAIRIRNGRIAEGSPQWPRLSSSGELAQAIPAIGQLRLARGGRSLGTVVLVAPGTFLTSRSAAGELVVGEGRAVRLVPDRPALINLCAEGPDSVGPFAPIAVTQAIFVHPNWDIALIGVESGDVPAAIAPVRIAAAEPEPSTRVVAIGHPGEVAPELAHLREAIYDDTVDVKRAMPGVYVGRRIEFSVGREVAAGRDDCSALSPDPGAAILDLKTGELVGIRFATEFADGNAFVPAWELIHDGTLAAPADLGDVVHDEGEGPALGFSGEEDEKEIEEDEFDDEAFTSEERPVKLDEEDDDIAGHRPLPSEEGNYLAGPGYDDVAATPGEATRKAPAESTQSLLDRLRAAREARQPHGAGAASSVVSLPSAQTIRTQLLDAHVARREGDLARAGAILELLPSDIDAPYGVDCAVLRAACTMRSDPARAGQILEEIVEKGARLSEADGDALVATRLRIAVDAQAERTFVALMRKYPSIVALTSPSRFHVIAADLPSYRWPSRWAQPTLPVTVSSNEPWADQAAPLLDRPRAAYVRSPLEEKFPRAAVRAAERIVIADAECARLVKWASEHAAHFIQLDFAGASGTERRALAAGLVGLPQGLVRPANAFLLDKVDLDAHPTRRWWPILDPLHALLVSSTRGTSLPSDLDLFSKPSLVRWLDVNARTTQFGSYLNRLIRVETDVPWAAGLLHMLTPLPIEGALERSVAALASGAAR